MKLKYVCLSFFKEQKISFFYNKKEERIYFPCPICDETVFLEIESANWFCQACDEGGTLKVLINFSNTGSLSTKKVYNPTKEKRDIRILYKNLLSSTQDEKLKSRFEYFMNKVENLIEYFDSEDKMTS
ncbi:hypothetical protein [Rossellomorea sp. NS-SX7]|uniref:hypothetical protein n=1 Tax=Rossellomorea sp. NS-SX7 TaxID=3463856 RepID=UPI004057F744